MPMVFVETLDDFIAEHGQAVEYEGRLLFEDGAKCDLRGTMRWNAPDDPTALLKSKRDYWTARVELLETDFHNMKAAFVEQAGWHEMNPINCPAPPADAAEILRDLKAAVKAARGKLREVEALLRETPDGKRRRHQEANEFARRTAANALASAIKSVEI